jgi:tetratricopeptide (TPR) repeat protein
MHEGHYQRALAYLKTGDWAVAEGALLQARVAAGQRDLAVADALAYALLMQGDYGSCARVLRPVLEHPQRSFWIHHKFGDALRGLHDLEGAARHFRQALAEGSNSPLTARNLLQVLHGLEPALALAELEGWPRPLPEPRLAGVREAAALVCGLELAAWLQDHNLADAGLRRRLAEQRLYGLEALPAGDGGGGEPLDSAAIWCGALQERLAWLMLTPGPATRLGHSAGSDDGSA